MSGLSVASVQRLHELEAKPALGSVERGELRSMTHSRPTADERIRLDRLLAASAPAQGEAAAPPSGDSYQRGLQRGSAAGGTAYMKEK